VNYLKKEIIGCKFDQPSNNFIIKIERIFTVLIFIHSYSNSSEFKGKLEIGKNSAAEFDTNFINIAELLMKSDSTERFL
jgi:hypothetical protein